MTNRRRNILEALLFVAGKPLGARALAEVTGWKSSEVLELLEELVAQYRERGVRIHRAASVYEMRTTPEAAEFVEKLKAFTRRNTLSRAARETLAIVAYRQPVTRAQIDSVRGVSSRGVIEQLMELGLIRVTGRAATLGRPLLFGTTREFLRWYGLNSLEELPALEESGRGGGM